MHIYKITEVSDAVLRNLVTLATTILALEIRTLKYFDAIQ